MLREHSEPGVDSAHLTPEQLDALINAGRKSSSSQAKKALYSSSEKDDQVICSGNVFFV